MELFKMIHINNIELLLIFDIYYLIMSLNIGLLEKLNTFSNIDKYNDSDDWLIYIPIINIFTLFILIIRYFQLK